MAILPQGDLQWPDPSLRRFIDPPMPPWAFVGNAVRSEVRFDDNHLMRMLASRLCWDEGDKKPFSFCAAHRMDDKVVVFVAHGGKGLVIEDELGLYPSDALVTQLRLLEAK